MNRRRLAAALAALLVAPLIAGCASDDAPPSDPTLQRGSSTTGSGVTSDPTPVTPTPRPKSSSERWHFHDYWKGSPTITLYDANVSFNASQDGMGGLPGLSALIALPPGTIVPAETGYLAVNVTWEAPWPGGAVNVTYRPADSQSFFGAGNVTNGVPAIINTTESMCDVPHRQESFWRFNVTPAPDAGTPPMLPPRDVRVVITATIGRQLFIDPPHVNWWQGGDAIPLVTGAKGEAATIVTKSANLSLLGAPPTVTAHPQTVRVAVDEGRIVPEGATSVVVLLNWTSEVGDGKLVVRYREANFPSEGPLDIAKDGKGTRVFVLPVRPAMTDTTYSNRTTWQFEVVPEGGDVAAFRGAFELHAWATKYSPAEAAIRMGL